jgi:prevent-host-death family protein
MSATEAARSFSAVLNRVSTGEQIEVTRAGLAIAVISPPPLRLLTAERFRELLETAPAPDERFASDLRAARAALPAEPDPWQS